MSFGAKAMKLALRASGAKKLYTLPEDEFLKKVEKMNKSRVFFMPKDNKAHYEDELIFGQHHCLKIMLSETPAERAVLFIFGGGMVLGSDKMDITVARKLAKESGCDVWFPYYPLCLEHDIEENIKVVFECYRRMTEVYGAGNVSTCGFSSGGMLAMAVGLYNNTLEEKLAMPRHVVAVSPGEVPGDDAERRRMMVLNDTDCMVDYEFMVKVEKFMRQGRDDLPDWMIHPSMGDFSGFPKIYFYYSADEVLYGARESFEAACRKYGVDYETDAQPNMYHCYCMMPFFPEAKEKFAEIAKILSR